MPSERIGLRLYRRLIALAPPEFRLRYEAEMLASLAALLLVERSRRGTLPAMVLWSRAMVDGWRTVRRERALRASAGGSPFQGFGDDLLFVVRSWGSARVFAATAIVSIGLGLALNAGIFSFADGFLFRDLPFDDPDRLFTVGERGTMTGLVTLDDFEEIERQRSGLAGVAQWDSAALAGRMEIDGQWFDAAAGSVTPGFANVLGFRMYLGRAFRDDDYRETAIRPAWASYEFWSRAMRRDRTVLGRRFRVGNTDIEIVGVMPALVSTFDLNNRPPDLVVPSREEIVPANLRKYRFASPIVRLVPGVSREQVEERLQAIVNAVSGVHPDAPADRRIYLTSLREEQVFGGRPTAVLLLSLSLLILLMVVVNLGHLLLARTIARAGEIGVRLALGASRWRVARLLLTESLALAICGSVVGLAGGWAVSAVIQTYVPRYPTGARNMAMVPIAFDHRVVLFTALLGALVALAAGLLPAWKFSVSRTLHVGRAPGAAVYGVRGRLARTILSIEVATATVVLIGTTLVGVSAWKYLNQPMGFDMDGKYLFSVRFDPLHAPPAAAMPALKEQLAATLRGTPGVEAVGFGGADAANATVEVRDRKLQMSVASVARVSASYFDALGLKIVAGRGFTSVEGASDAAVALVDEKAARILWPEREPLGQTVRDTGGQDRTVIGVTAHARWRLKVDGNAKVYVPEDPARPQLSAVIAGPAQSERLVVAEVMRSASAVLPNAAVSVYPLKSMLLRDVGEYQFQGPIVAILGALAFLLATFGLYGVVTYLVEQRLREFGVRVALGARPSDIWSSVVRESLLPTLAGLIVGLGIALATTQTLRSLLFGVQPNSPWILTVVAATLGLASVLAAVRPARRAMSVDPVAVLRAN